MGYLEVSKGPWTIYGDVVWGKFGFSDGAVAQAKPALTGRAEGCRRVGARDSEAVG